MHRDERYKTTAIDRYENLSARHHMLRCLCPIAVVALTLAAVLMPSVVWAHPGHSGPRQTLTQTIGPYALTVTLEPPTARRGGPLFVEISSDGGAIPAELVLEAVKTGGTPQITNRATIRMARSDPGPYYTQLAVDTEGFWDVHVRATGPNGIGTALIPFTVAATSITVAGRIMIAAALALGGIAFCAIVLVGYSARRERPLARSVIWTMREAAVVCIVVAIMAGVQHSLTPLAVAGIRDRSTIAPVGVVGRPHINVVLHTEPARPRADKLVTLTMDLVDGSTGRPVEDLAAHHDALMHLIVTSDDGAAFAHLHPARVAPGRYQTTFTPDQGGRFVAYVEVARHGSGTQVVERAFEVDGMVPAMPARTTNPNGVHAIGGLMATVRAPQSIASGTPTVLTVAVVRDGKPVTDLQPWLGMGGHLLVRRTDGSVFAHVHAVGAMTAPGVTPSTTRYGPEIQFVYTFPDAGQYDLWVQWKHDHHIYTLPLHVDITAT